MNEEPFFVAGAGGGVLVARAVPVPQGEAVLKSWELATPEQDAAYAEVADLLRAIMPRARSYRSPLLVDDWRERVTKAASESPGDVALLFSAPGGIGIDPKDLAGALIDCAQPWVAEFAPGISALEAFSGCAWLWKASALPSRTFVSNFEPPEDSRVRDVVAPDGKSRADKVTKGARRIRLLRKDDASSEQRLVMGIVLEPETVDSQGDIYSSDEITRAAHGWMEQFQNMGHMHQVIINTGVKPVESYVAPVDFSIGDQPVKQGTWILVVHVVNDAVWAQVKAGELTGFSIGGFAQRVPAQQVAGDT